MAGVQVVVVTPEKTELEQKADFVVLPLFDGEAGILPGHARMIGRLGFGELRVRNGSKTERYYVDGGFAQVADDVISVLTSRTIPVSAIDVAAAEQQLRDAETMPVQSSEQVAARDRELGQARAQIRMARQPKS